jgi:subtilase family serine protease
MGGLTFFGKCYAKTCSKDDTTDWAIVQGQLSQESGTSAASPDIVGLLALATQIYGKPLGDVHQAFYAAAKQGGVFRRGILGNNGFATSTGAWDPVLGIGTPIKAYKFVGASTPAGHPGTPSNP